MTRPDLDAILPPVSAEDEATVDALLAKAREGVGKRPIGSRPDLDAIRARWPDGRLANTDAREDVLALLAYIDELEREIAVLRPRSVMLKRAHGALTDAGCVVPLEFDQSIEHAINDLARRATRAEQLFVDEYDARRDVERERDELLRVNQGAAQHGIITEYVRELTELLGIQRKNPTANETVNAAATEIETLRTTVEELKARITTLEAMKP